MKPSDDDSLSDIEQYYGFDLKSIKSHHHQYRVTWKKLIIYIGLFLAIVTMEIMLVIKNNSWLPQLHQSLQNNKSDASTKLIN